jgi:hypothetical protein
VQLRLVLLCSAQSIILQSLRSVKADCSAEDIASEILDHTDTRAMNSKDRWKDCICRAFGTVITYWSLQGTLSSISMTLHSRAAFILVSESSSKLRSDPTSRFEDVLRMGTVKA